MATARKKPRASLQSKARNATGPLVVCAGLEARGLFLQMAGGGWREVDDGDGGK